MFQSKKILFYILFLLLTGIFLNSCKTNFVSIQIENAQAAKEELAPDIQSITLMNRSMSNQFLNHIEDSLQSYFYRNGYQLSKIVLDSMAADTTIKALAALLYESGRYDVVIPLERNIPRNGSYHVLPDPLDQELVQQLCTDYKTDALMVLERFSTKVMSDYSREKYNDPNFGVSYYYYASLDLKYDAYFRIYKPGLKTVMKEIELSDTINWESAENNQVNMFRQLPSIKMALINAGIRVALDADSQLSPTWIRENRGYFLFNQKNDRGQVFMEENNYAGAAEYWAELAKSKNKNIRSKAEFNMALISELNGNLDSAIEWGLKSFYSYYRNQTEVYLKKLQFRKENQLKTN